MRLILLKAQKFANQAGYFLQNGRWHKTSQDKPAPKGAPVSAHPHAAGKPVQKETLAEHEWSQLKLPAENSNAGTFNKQLDQLKAAAAAGDVTGILGSGYGTNTYGKKLAIIANHVLGLLGSDHKVTPGQKAGSHAAVQTAPEIAAEAHAEKPEPKQEPKPELKPEPKAPASGKALTSNQKDIIEGIENYLGLNLMASSAYVKNNVINIETDGLQQHNLHAIENYGTQFGKFKVEPGGHKKISLVLPKKDKEAPKAEAKAEKPAPKATKPDADLAVPEFAEGKQAKGVKAHYEKVAKKIIRAAKDGDLSALQFMPSDKGNTWKGKTDNSKKLLALHQAAIAHAEAQKGPGKDIQHPDAEKKAAQEAKELAKEGVTPKEKPEPKKAETSIQDAIAAAGSVSEAQHAAEQYISKHSGTAKGKAYDEAISALAEHGYSAGLLHDWKKQDHADGKLGNYDLKEKDPLLNKLKEAKSSKEVEKVINGMIAASGSGDSTIDTAIKYLKDSGHSDLVPKYEAMKSDSKTASDGPKDGETKEGADGTLVFKDGRWHKQGETKKAEQKTADKEHPNGDAASKLSQIPWDNMLLPDSNKNAKSHNKQVAKIKAMAEAGDIEGLKNFKAGTNTYGKKQNLLAQTALAALEESAPAPKAEKVPPTSSELFSGMTKPPEFKDKAEFVKWFWGSGYEAMEHEGIAKYGSVAAWNASPEVEYLDTLSEKYEGADGSKEPAPAEKPKAESVKVPDLPEFKTVKEMEDWTATPEYKKWNDALVAKYGSQAAANKSPETEKFNDLYADLFTKDDEPTAKAPPQKPAGASLTYNKIESAMLAGDSSKLAEIIELKSEFAGESPFSPGKKSYDYAMAAYKHVTGKDYVSPQTAASAANAKPQKPTGLTSVHWSSTVDEIEAQMNAGNEAWLQTQVEQTASLQSAEAKAVNGYAIDALGYVQEQKQASAENDGPKEGETKQGADGMLVFKNGRWHKMGDEKSAEKPAPAGPADVEIPEFTGLSPNHTKSMNKAAEALKAKIAAEGKAGFKGVLTNHKDGKVTVHIDGVKISKASVASSSPAFAAFAKFVDELKASTGVVKKAKPAPKPAPAPAPEPEPQKPIESMDHWEQTGGQGGSNPGGKFKDENGVEWYCKFPENDHIAKAEVLAAKLYSALGLNAQDAKIVTKDGKVGIASRWQDVKKASPKELAQTPGVLEGFAADAWLANWDVVGLAYDNLQVDSNGHAMRVDAGGSLMYRAQGSKKAFGEHVTELDSLRDPKINPQAAAVFGKMSEADITASVAKVAQISDAQIRIMVNNFGPGDKTERKALAETLIARKNDLIAKYPKAVKVKKKRLDPENLPVKEERLPKEHDFANWNGPGAGLSSKAAVNAANQKVESEMLAIAKSGNLNKLKDYKFQPVDIATGEPKGDPIPVGQHPSKHVQQFHQDLIQALDEIANPPQPLKIFQESDLNTLDELDMAFPSKKFGTTVNAVHSNEKMGFWVVLGGVHKAAEKFMPKKITHFTTEAIEAAYQKFKEGSKLAKHFILSVQASGSYNDLFREGKEFDHHGNKLSDVAKAALEYATEQPEGTAVYRWQQMTKDMVDKIMSAPDGTVFQATGSMCTSMSPTATSHFGPHRVKIVYAKGAKAVESFGSGKFAGEKEVTTLPNSRFVIMKKEMVPNEKGSGKRLELEVLMLPPDLGL